MEAIPEDDIQRLKWYGLFLRNPTPGFFMLRVRIPGGQTTSSQLKRWRTSLSPMAMVSSMTTRQQVQPAIRTIAHVPAVFAKNSRRPA